MIRYRFCRYCELLQGILQHCWALRRCGGVREAYGLRQEIFRCADYRTFRGTHQNTNDSQTEHQACSQSYFTIASAFGFESVAWCGGSASAL